MDIEALKLKLQGADGIDCIHLLLGYVSALGAAAENALAALPTNTQAEILSALELARIASAGRNNPRQVEGFGDAIESLRSALP